MSRMWKAWSSGVVALILCAPAAGYAQSGQNQGGESGVGQLGRGSAWVATADDPLATYYNPAALATMRPSIHIGTHLMRLDRCFTRVSSGGGPVSPAPGFPAYGTAGSPATVCLENSTFVNPQFAGNFRIGDRLGIGIAALGPHGIGELKWPETVSYNGGVMPSPTRFIQVYEKATLSFTTFSAGYRVTDRLLLGAGFVWGSIKDEAYLYGEGLSPAPPAGQPPADDFIGHREVRVSLDVTDNFAPGLVAGVLFMPTDTIDVGVWYRKNDALDMKTDLRVQANYWNPDGTVNQNPCAGQSPNCNITDPDGREGATRFVIPTEIHTGVRYHKPRAAMGTDGRGRPVRDPLVDDLYSIEVDLNWANNSAVESVDITMARSGIPVIGVPGATLPDKISITKQWRDTVALRVGGQYVLSPGRFALQAGTFIENKSHDDEDTHLHFDLARRTGLSFGAVYRYGRSEFTVAYQRLNWATLDNRGNGTITAFSGDPSSDHASRQIVNGGRLTSSMNEFGISYLIRF